MELSQWSKSEVEYGKKLMHAGLGGARSGEQEFLRGGSLSPYIRNAAMKSLIPALCGSLLGLFSGTVCRRRISPSRVAIFGLVGGIVGFAVGLSWESRDLSTSVANRALKDIGKVRDEHWFEKNPIDYA